MRDACHVGRSRQRARAVDVRGLHSGRMACDAVHDRGEMHDCPNPGQWRRQGLRALEVTLRPLRGFRQSRGACFVSHQHADGLAATNQLWNQVAADEAGTTCDENHVVAPATGSRAPVRAAGGRDVGLMARLKYASPNENAARPIIAHATSSP
jgi:hypothetical protein